MTKLMSRKLKINQILPAIISYWLICLFISAGELEQKSSSYGIGSHRLHDDTIEADQLISRLSKGGYTYNVERNSNGLRIYRFPNAITEEIENIVQFNPSLYLSSRPKSEAWIVDVHDSGNEIAFLMAVGMGYQYFKVTNQEIVVPNGWFIMERVGVNTVNWRVNHFQDNPSHFGETFLDWSHSDEIKKIRLLNIDTIELEPNDLNQSVTFSIGASAILKENAPITDGLLYNPHIESETNLIQMFSLTTTPTFEDVKFIISCTKGGKDFVLNLLNQFTDKNAANQIRMRINEAYAEN